MSPIVRNILAIITGWGVGSLSNMGLINLGHYLFPIEGIDKNDLDALSTVMQTLSFKYFIFPFLAHAIGTLIGAFTASKIASTHKRKIALIIGALFLIGGIIINFLIPSPFWFIWTDIIIAYIPMAIIGWRLANI